MNTIYFGGVAVTAPATWGPYEEPGLDVFTLARDDGGGALQFSPARYKSGKVPDMRPMVGGLLEDFTLKTKELRAVGQVSQGTAEGRSWAARSFEDHASEEPGFVRVWYLSDGPNVAFISYTADPATATEQIAEAEAIALSLRFEARDADDHRSAMNT